MGFGVHKFVKHTLNRAKTTAHPATAKYDQVAGNKFGAVGITVATGGISQVQIGAKGPSMVNQALSAVHTAGPGAGSASKKARQTQGKLYGKPLVAGTNLVAPGSGSAANILAKTGILSKIPGIKDFADGYLGPQAEPDAGGYAAPEADATTTGLPGWLLAVIVGAGLLVLSVVFLLFRGR